MNVVKVPCFLLRIIVVLSCCCLTIIDTFFDGGLFNSHKHFSDKNNIIRQNHPDPRSLSFPYPLPFTLCSLPSLFF